MNSHNFLLLCWYHVFVLRHHCLHGLCIASPNLLFSIEFLWLLKSHSAQIATRKPYHGQEQRAHDRIRPKWPSGSLPPLANDSALKNMRFPHLDFSQRWPWNASWWMRAHDGGISDDLDPGNHFIVERYKKGRQGGIDNLVSRITRRKIWNVWDAKSRRRARTRTQHARAEVRGWRLFEEESASRRSSCIQEVHCRLLWTLFTRY